MAEGIQDEVNRLNQIVDKINFKAAGEAMQETERELNLLPGKLGELRAGGYVFKSHFENQLSLLSEQWQRQRPFIGAQLSAQQASLRAEASGIQTLHARQVLAGSALASLERKVDEVQRGLEAMYQGLRDSVKQLAEQIADALWTLNQLQSASFALQPGEMAVEAVPANWKKPGDNDGVEGVLFLTDRRLLFEQREEVATKKVLFITTAKQKLQSLQWELPLSALTATAASKRGFMNKDDYLTLTASQGPFQTTDLHLRGESGESWRAVLERVRSGAIQQERAGQPAAAFKWGTVMPVIVAAAEGPIRLRAAGQARCAGSLDPAWLNSIINQRFADVAGASFHERSRAQLPAFQAELPALLKSALLADIQAQGAALIDIQVDLLQETPL